jgi:hypothetical protein
MKLSTAYSIVIKYSQHPHDATIDSVIERWKTFKPSITSPSPGTTFSNVHMNEKEFYDNYDKEATALNVDPQTFPVQDFHDVAAVLAGSKPAALVQSPEILDHPLGKRLFERLKLAGHSIIPIHTKKGLLGLFKTKEVQEYIVGPEEHAQKVVQALNRRGDPVALGRALGYPEEAIQEFVERVRKSHRI